MINYHKALLIGFVAVPMAISECPSSTLRDFTDEVLVAADDNLGNHQKFFHGRPVKSTYRSNVVRPLEDSLQVMSLTVIVVSVHLRLAGVSANCLCKDQHVMAI